MTLSFDAIVNGLVAKGVGRDRAEAIARAELRISLPDPAAERNAEVLEKAEQAEITQLFRAFGFKVRNLSQARASKQAPGLADLWCVHRELPIAFWWESKRQVGGEYSAAQLEFREDCLRCGVGCAGGDRRAAAEHLVSLGLAYITATGTLEPARRLERLQSAPSAEGAKE